MEKTVIEQLIVDIDQHINDLIVQRDNLRAILALEDQLDDATKERLTSGIISAMKARAAEIDAVIPASALNTQRSSKQ